MIATYTDLIATVLDILDDPDGLEAKLPTYIQLVEGRLNRLLDDPEMEVISDSVASGDYTALPDDFGEMVSITTGNGKLQQMGGVEFAGLDHTIAGIPRFYAIVNRAIAFAPANGTTPITMVYRRRIPALTADNPTNWLLERAPDIYLYGLLMWGEARDADDERIDGWKSGFDEAIGELRIDGTRRKWGAGPISPRIARP
jgi:hypothetical protein